MYLFVILAIILVIPALTISQTISAGGNRPYGIVLKAVIGTGVIFAVMFMFSSMAKQGVFAHIQQVIKAVCGQLAADPIWDSLPGFEGLSIKDRTAALENFYETLAMKLPAYALVATAVVAYLEYRLISRMPHSRTKAVRMPHFSEFTLPPGAFMGIFIMYFAAWIISTGDSIFGQAVYANVNVIFDTAFALQGMSLVLYFAKMKRIPKAVGVIAIIILLSNSILFMVLVIAGMLDLVMGLRVRIKGKTAGK